MVKLEIMVSKKRNRMYYELLVNMQNEVKALRSMRNKLNRMCETVDIHFTK